MLIKLRKNVFIFDLTPLNIQIVLKGHCSNVLDNQAASDHESLQMIFSSNDYTVII